LVLDPVDRRLETGISLCRAEDLDVAPDAAALSFAELPDHKTDWLFAEMPTAPDRNTHHSSTYSGIQTNCPMRRDGTGALASGYATTVVDQSGDWQWDFSHQKGTTTSDGSSAGPTLVQLLFGHRFPDPDIKSTLTI
jgi:hypothetical protein